MQVDKMWHKSVQQLFNCRAVAELISEYEPELVHQPSPEQAPWHWRVIFADASFSIWPHIPKACTEGGQAVIGISEIKRLIDETLEIAAGYDGDLFEDFSGLVDSGDRDT